MSASDAPSKTRRDATSEQRRRVAEVRLEDLPDVHAARHAQRVQHDLAPACRPRGTACPRSGRILADHALVAVAAGHLVADGQVALRGDVDLHQLEHARGQLVAAREAVDRLVLDGLGIVDGRRSAAWPPGGTGRRRAAPPRGWPWRRRSRSSRSSGRASTPFVEKGLPVAGSTSLRPSISSHRVDEQPPARRGRPPGSSSPPRGSASGCPDALLRRCSTLRENFLVVDHDALDARRRRRGSRSSRPRRPGRRSRAGASPRGRARSWTSARPCRRGCRRAARACRCARCPSSSRLRRARSETFGMSFVNSSRPSFVSRISISNMSMWIDV